MIKFTQTALVSLVFLSLFVCPLHADSSSDLVVARFVNALLADSSNTTAKKYLKRIAKSDAVRTKRQELSLLRFIELIDFSDSLKSRIKYLQTTNTRFMEFILKDGKSDESIMKSARSIQARIPDAINSYRKRPAILRRVQTLKTLNITKLNQALVREKRGLMRQLDMLRNIHTQLRPIKIKAAKNLIVSKKQKFPNRFTQQIDEIKLKLVETDRRVGELTGELAKMSLELYEKNNLLRDKDSRITLFEDNLVDARERLNLVQRIIKEKDKDIHILEKKIADPQSGIMPQANLARIQSLEQQFQDLNEKHSRMEKLLAKKDSTISQLKETVSSKNRKILISRKASLLKSRGLVQLDGIVQIYRGRLKDTYVDLMEKTERVKRLEDKLMQMERVKESGRWDFSHPVLGSLRGVK